MANIKSQQSLKDKTIKGTMWSAIDNVAKFGVAFIVSIVLARLLSPDSVLNVLYDCSAIGHAYPYGNGGQTRITFKYRNRNSSFNKSNRIILHKGL